MPYSSPEGKLWALEQLRGTEINRILDVGPGAGSWGHLLRGIYPDVTIDAVEIWEPYIPQFKLDELYNGVHVSSVQDFYVSIGYDLVVFGDVVEHMPKEVAVRVVNRLVIKLGIIAVPIVESIQGPYEGNPYEEHVHQWTCDEVLEAFPVARFFRGEQIGVFVVTPSV